MLQKLDRRTEVSGDVPADASPHLPELADPDLASDLATIITEITELASLLQVATERETDPIRTARAVLARTTCEDLSRQFEVASQVSDVDAILTLFAEMNDLCAEVAAIELLPRD